MPQAPDQYPHLPTSALASAARERHSVPPEYYANRPASGVGWADASNRLRQQLSGPTPQAGVVPSDRISRMVEVANSAEFFAALRNLIEAWCDRRCLKALNHVLPAYLSFNRLTDGWNRLYDALRNVRTFAQDELTASELDTVSVLIRVASQVIHREPPPS